MRRHDQSNKSFSSMLAEQHETPALSRKTFQSGGGEEYRKKVPECPETAVGFCFSNAYDDRQSQERLCEVSVERTSVLPAPSHMGA
jgi:hypothetical protein